MLGAMLHFFVKQLMVHTKYVSLSVYDNANTFVIIRKTTHSIDPAQNLDI